MNFFTGDLASLLQPVSVDEFFREYWGKQPLYIPRQNPDYYRGLYSRADIDDFLRFSAPVDGWNEKVKMAIKFKMVPSEALFERNQPGFDYRMIGKSLRAVSLILNFIQEHNNRVYQMAKLMERDLRGRIKGCINVNAYLSPGNSYINPHVDSHDELNIQMEGTKRWRVYEPRVHNTYPDMPLDDGFDPETRTLFIRGRKPCMEVVLQPGDFIYMPRGFWHDPVNTDSEPSLGLTLGVHPVCWLDTVIGSVKAAAENCPELRQSIPVPLDPENEQLLRKNIRDFSAATSGSASLDGMIANLRRNVEAEKSGPENLYLPSREAVDALGPDAALCRHGDTNWKFSQSYGLLRFKVGRREIGLRKELKAALEQIHPGACFTPNELPGELTQQEKIQFCRFLLNFGAIQFNTPKDVQ